MSDHSAIDRVFDFHIDRAASQDDYDLDVQASAELASLRAAVADRDAAIARAVAEERERCAKVAEYHYLGTDEDDDYVYGEDIAAAIRARGERKERERVIDAVNELSKLIGGML